jgi:hypothetical protein
MYKNSIKSGDASIELATEETYVAQRSKTKKIMRTALCKFKNKILGELLDENPKSFCVLRQESSRVKLQQ